MSVNILVVDDDADDIQLFKEAVEDIDLPLNCHTELDGLEALNLLGKSEVLPDMIVVDLNMPKLNGFDFIKEVRKISKYNSIKLFLYSTNDLKNEIREENLNGLDGFFRKPYTVAELSDHIVALIKLCNSQPSPR